MNREFAQVHRGKGQRLIPSGNPNVKTTVLQSPSLPPPLPPPLSPPPSASSPLQLESSPPSAVLIENKHTDDGSGDTKSNPPPPRKPARRSLVSKAYGMCMQRLFHEMQPMYRFVEMVLVMLGGAYKMKDLVTIPPDDPLWKGTIDSDMEVSPSPSESMEDRLTEFMNKLDERFKFWENKHEEMKAILSRFMGELIQLQKQNTLKEQARPSSSSSSATDKFFEDDEDDEITLTESAIGVTFPPTTRKRSFSTAFEGKKLTTLPTILPKLGTDHEMRILTPFLRGALNLAVSEVNEVNPAATIVRPITIHALIHSPDGVTTNFAKFVAQIVQRGTHSMTPAAPGHSYTQRPTRYNMAAQSEAILASWQYFSHVRYEGDRLVHQSPPKDHVLAQILEDRGRSRRRLTAYDPRMLRQGRLAFMQ